MPSGSGANTTGRAAAYLAAFARAGDLGLVTFDRDFTRFPELRLSLLG